MRNQSIDSLKLMFSISVVVMHGYLLDITNPGYLTGLLTNGFFIAAVPFYFIVSGYLFYKTILKSHVRKWYFHISKTYLIWSIVYAYTLANIMHLTDASLSRKLYLMFRAELTGVVHLWFIPSLITASLMCYLLRGFIQQRPRVTLALIAVVWVLGVALNWRLLFIHSLNTFWYKNGFFYGGPMFVLGYMFSSHEDKIINRVIDFKKALAIVSVFIIVESLITTTVIKHLGHTLYSSMDMMITTPLLAALIFISCLKNPALRIMNGMERLLSTFMYYSHILFMSIMVWFFSTVNLQWSGSARDIMVTGLTVILVIVIGLKFKNKVQQIV